MNINKLKDFANACYELMYMAHDCYILDAFHDDEFQEKQFIKDIDNIHDALNISLSLIRRIRKEVKK
jgi:hypothetical protein